MMPHNFSPARIAEAKYVLTPESIPFLRREGMGPQDVIAKERVRGKAKSRACQRHDRKGSRSCHIRLAKHEIEQERRKRNRPPHGGDSAAAPHDSIEPSHDGGVFTLAPLLSVEHCVKLRRSSPMPAPSASTHCSAGPRSACRLGPFLSGSVARSPVLNTRESAVLVDRKAPSRSRTAVARP